jgi:general secretion pathway protein A
VYLHTFGFREPAFSITPDPRYLFLSPQHREALAHLLYGAGEYGGFILLTGDIGTGKTTICRALLEQLPDSVQVALIFNPALTAYELMVSICTEFGLEPPPAAASEASLQHLIEQLHQFLLTNHAQGKRLVLIIDEAQTLQPSVLEHIRLLTNLETTRTKLLQIFLIGQPELRILLDTPALEQLQQRITARYHLSALQAHETSAYIRHRLAVAGVAEPLFTRSALRQIHRNSRGVPRLINLICDRALLGAALNHRRRVTRIIAERAAHEVLTGTNTTQPTTRPWLLAILVMLIILWWWSMTPSAESVRIIVIDRLVAALQSPPAVRMPYTAVSTVVIPTREVSDPPPPVVTAPESEISVIDDPPFAEPSQPPQLPVSLPAPPVLADAVFDQVVSPLNQAYMQLLRYWDVSIMDVSQPIDCAQLTTQGLGCLTDRGRWNDLRRFNRPVILQLLLPDGRTDMVVVRALDDEFATLAIDQQLWRIPIATLDERWSGDYSLLWRLPPSHETVIGRSASTEAIQWFRQRLAQWPASGLGSASIGHYDETLLATVRRFQAAYGLEVDGIAGPKTLITLAHVLQDRTGPRLLSP